MGRNNFVNIGEQRFEKIRERKAFYIDKSDFIREWWDTGTTVTLITRPRRFGKTLNMSMLFIDNDGEYDTYWADTSGNGLVNSLIRQGNTTVKSGMEDLLAGRTLTTELNEQIVFNQLDGSTGAEPSPAA